MREIKVSKPIGCIIGLLTLMLCNMLIVHIKREACRNAWQSNLWEGVDECNAVEVKEALQAGADPTLKGGSESWAGTPLRRAQACTNQDVYILLKQAGAKE